nr:hypothetical protein HmN_000541100 [Hymenolepis microstoma]
MSSDVCSLVNSCWKGKRKRDFAIVLLLETKNWYITVTLTQAVQKIMEIVRWSYTSADEFPWLTSHALRLVGDQLGVIYYELLKPPQMLHRLLIFTSLISLNDTWPGSPELELAKRSVKLDRLMDLIERCLLNERWAKVVANDGKLMYKKHSGQRTREIFTVQSEEKVLFTEH